MITSSPEIKQVILDWYQCIASGEMVSAAENILSHEPGFVALGTDDTEWLGDRVDLIKAYGEAAKLGKPEISVQQLEAYQEGSVGWAVDRIMFRRPGRKEIPMRHTFVLHREQDEWKVIHAHYSFPFTEESLLASEA